MNKLYNIGDSFSYGNCLCEFEEFATDGEGNIIHLSPGDILAKELGYEHINLASPGLSPDGVLRRLYSNKFEADSFLLIGIPPANRFQTVAQFKRDQHRDRSHYKGTEAKHKAFMYGPEMQDDWFRTHSYLSERLKRVNIEEQLTFNVLFNILLIQKRLIELNLKYVMYNCVYGHMGLKSKLNELNAIKEQIKRNNYYQPKYGIQDLVNTNKKYQVARDDPHPNHLCYLEWCKMIINYLKKEEII